jgi:NADH-quinone oxidoreductase subunit C
MAKNQDKAREASPTREVSKKIHLSIEELFGSELVSYEDAVDPYTVIHDGTKFLMIMGHLRNDPDLRFDFLRSVAGVDYPEDERIASVYHLFSYTHKHAHVIKFYCERENPEVPSVEKLWPTANWFERECYDLLGIIYLGHSDLRRIMLPDDWVGFPLRKDYAEQADYHGIGTTRASPLDAFAQMDETRRKARDERGDPVPAPQISAFKPKDDAKDDASTSSDDAGAET